MYNSGDAAEQVVRMSLEGAEFALKITGSAAKNLAAALYTVLKDQKKTKGKARIEAMLREKRPLKVYTIKKEDCPEFAKQAKGYGILYAPIPVKKGDDTIDILVFEDDAARANRIVEKFKLTVVDTASIKEDIEKSREQRGSEPAAPEQAMPEKSEDDQLLDELMEKPVQKEKAQPEHPAAEKTDSFTPAAEKSHPSAPISENSSKSARGTSDGAEKAVRPAGAAGHPGPAEEGGGGCQGRGAGCAPEEGGSENHPAPAAQTQKETQIEREVICDE